MSINGINGPANVARTELSNTDTPASGMAAAAGKSGSAAEVDKVTQKPLPTRFPWLSRLSHELEAASKQRSPFDSAPVLGDNLDKSA